MNNNRIVTGAAALVAAAGLAFGGVSLASADDSTSTPNPTSTSDGSSVGSSDGSQGNTDPSKPMRSDEELLTGDTLAKVTAAVEAKEPDATIERVETDSEGVFEAHLVRADGTHITVQVDASFAVTAVHEGGPNGSGGPGGRGGHGPGDQGAEHDGDHDGAQDDGTTDTPSSDSTSDPTSDPTSDSPSDSTSDSTAANG